MRTSFVKSLRQFLKREIGHSQRVLDVGCGDGTTALHLISALRCDVRGIDAAAGKIHSANANFRGKLHTRRGICALAKAEEVSPALFRKPFNAVLLIHVFHHLDDAKKALVKLKRVLVRGGKIIIVEYTDTFGETVDNCPRFSAKKARSLTAQSGFQRSKKYNVSRGMFAIVGYK